MITGITRGVVTSARNASGNVATMSSAELGWSLARHVVERQRILGGMTRSGLAHAARLDEKTVRNALNGRRRPTLATADCIARALNLHLTDVIVIVEGRRKGLARRSESEQLRLDV